MTLAAPASRLPWLGIAAGVFGVVGFSTLLVVGRIGATSQTLTLYDLAGLRHSVSILCALPILIRIWPWRCSLVGANLSPRTQERSTAICSSVDTRA